MFFVHIYTTVLADSVGKKGFSLFCTVPPHYSGGSWRGARDPGSCSSVVVLELFARFIQKCELDDDVSGSTCSCIIILLNVLGQQRIEKKKKILSDGDVVVSVSSAHRPFCLVKPK